MNIAKATLRQLLGTKWKFCLVVALFGVGLVVLTHVSDVAGTLERIAGSARGAPNPEAQAEQMATAFDSFAMLALYGALGALFFLGASLVGFLMPGGIVANERHSSAIMLWAQHPMSLARFYGQRYLGIQLGNLAAQALFGILAVIAVLPRLEIPAGVAGAAGNPGIPSTETGLFVEVCLSGALACAISFGITALGLRRAALLALAYFAGSSVMGGIFAPGSPLVPASMEWLQDLLPFLVFPNFQIQSVVAGFDSGVAWDWKATGMVLYHFAVWTGVALLGLRRIDRRPLTL